MIHDRLDIAHWKSVFPLDRLRAEARASGQRPPEAGDIASDPYGIAVLEQLREASYAIEPDVERMPTDLFIWNRGETERRAVTKIGGLPYRAAGKPWPLAPSGIPMTFVAQFNFADSHDLVPSLPGDVLLVLAEGKEWSAGKYNFQWGEPEGSEYNSAVAFEWVFLGDFSLVTEDEVPATGWQIMPCWGTIYRTYDYPGVDGFAYPEVSAHIPEITGGTKIGGMCPWIQGEEDIPGTFLCALASVDAEIYKSYPFLNVPDPIPWNEWSESHRLLIGDVGLMYIFVNSYGDLRWTAQGH